MIVKACPHCQQTATDCCRRHSGRRRQHCCLNGDYVDVSSGNICCRFYDLVPSVERSVPLDTLADSSLVAAINTQSFYTIRTVLCRKLQTMSPHGCCGFMRLVVSFIQIRLYFTLFIVFISSIHFTVPLACSP